MTFSLTFEHVGKKFDDTTILRDVTFETEPGEFVVLVGPSGCGKSTLLRLVAGLETITEGTIRAGDRVLNDIPPQDRGVGMVFQSYALYPHMTVRENLRFPLYVKKVSREQQEKAVGEVAGLLGLDALLDRLPKQLSGGQRQRVAIGRCLVRKPDIYCFDEPLSNLDASLRTQLRVEIRALQRRLNKTTLYVTHDQVEAMTLADRIVVLNGGIVQQVGSPEQLYTRPANRFVAQFIGTPSMSIIRGECRDGMFRSGELSVRCPRPDGPLLLGVRVEDVLVVGQGGPDADVGDSSADPMFDATVGGVEPVGESGYLHLDVAGVEFADAKSDGDDTALRLIASVPGHAAFRYQLQERVSLRLRSDRCHWFDVETGDAVSSDDQEERP